MSDYTWRQAYEEWENGNQDSEEAFKAGWLAAMAHVAAMVEDLRTETGEQP